MPIASVKAYYLHRHSLGIYVNREVFEGMPAGLAADWATCGWQKSMHTPHSIDTSMRKATLGKAEVTTVAACGSVPMAIFISLLATGPVPIRQTS